MKFCVTQSTSNPQIACSISTSIAGHTLSFPTDGVSSTPSLTRVSTHSYYSGLDNGTVITELVYSTSLNKLFGIGEHSGLTKFCKFNIATTDNWNGSPLSKIELQNEDGSQTLNLEKFVLDENNDMMVGYMRIDSSTRTLCVYNGVINANITGVYSATRCLTSTFTKNKDEIDLKYLLG